MQWEVFCRDTLDQQVVAGCFGRHGDVTYLNQLVEAWGWTLAIALSALAVALVAGTAVGILRTLPSRAAVAFGETWTELFRNVPLLVQLFLWYHVVPAVFPALRALPSFALVVAGLGFFTSARIAEQVRAGILSLPRGQREAGLAIGLTLPQTYRHVLLPTAFRVVLPPLTSEAMNVVKNSAVAFALGIAELTAFAIQAQEETARGVEIYLATDRKSVV